MSSLAISLSRPQTFVEARRGGLTIIDLLERVEWFREAAPWTAWKAFLAAVYGLPMSEEQIAIFRACTGRQDPPTTQATEVYCIAGRRARKSAIEALMGVWAAASTDWTPADPTKAILAPNERALIPLLGKNKFDARAIRGFALNILRCDSMKWLLDDDADVGEEIRLTVPCDLVIRAASLMAGRSRTIPIACLDEAAFWAQEGAAVSDEEVLQGIRPGMATLGGEGMLVVMSSPWTKTGILGHAYDDHWGKDGSILVWKADTLTMHDTPALRAYIAAQYERDWVGANTEYGAAWREMSEQSYISEAMLDAVIVAGRTMLRPERKYYWAFADPSGGGEDSFTLAISHWQPAITVKQDDGTEVEMGGLVVVDRIVEWAGPLDTDSICEKAAVELKAYGVTTVYGDMYAGHWVRDRFRKLGIMYVHSQLNKSQIYCEFLPILSSQRVELPEHPVMVQQLLRLTRRPAARGADLVAHPTGEHDDVANVVAGSVVRAYEYGSKRGEPEPEPEDAATTTAEMFRRRKRDLYEKEKAIALGKYDVSSPRDRRRLRLNR